MVTGNVTWNDIKNWRILPIHVSRDNATLTQQEQKISSRTYHTTTTTAAIIIIIIITTDTHKIEWRKWRKKQKHHKKSIIVRPAQTARQVRSSHHQVESHKAKTKITAAPQPQPQQNNGNHIIFLPLFSPKIIIMMMIIKTTMTRLTPTTIQLSKETTGRSDRLQVVNKVVSW